MDDFVVFCKIWVELIQTIDCMSTSYEQNTIDVLQWFSSFGPWFYFFLAKHYYIVTEFVWYLEYSTGVMQGTFLNPSVSKRLWIIQLRKNIMKLKYSQERSLICYPYFGKDKSRGSRMRPKKNPNHNQYHKSGFLIIE